MAGLTIQNHANTTVTALGGDVYRIVKNSGAGTAYNADAVSATGISGDFVLRVQRVGGTGNQSAVGVNSDPLTDSNYTSIDYCCIYDLPSLKWYIYESGTYQSVNFAEATYLWIWRSGTTLGYGTGADLATAQASPARTVTNSATLYFDSSFFGEGTSVDVIFATGTAIISGSAAATEGPDTAAITGSVADAGTAAATEAADTAAAAGSSSISGSGADSESVDTLAASGRPAVSGAEAATEGTDAAAITAADPVSGSAAAVEAADVASSSGAESEGGVGAIIESQDVASASGSILITGSANIVEAADTPSGAGGGDAMGVVAIVERRDFLNAFGNKDGHTLLVGVAEDGYSVAFPAEVHTDKVAGGLPRSRKQVAAANPVATVQWFLNAHEFDYFRAFYRIASAKGAAVFTLDLVVHAGAIMPYSAQFVPGSLQIAELNGDAYVVGAQLEVRSMPMDTDLDASIVLLYETYGDGAPGVLDLLAQLVNFDMPAAWGDIA